MSFPLDRTPETGALVPSRRRFVQGLAAGGALLAFGARRPLFAATAPRVPELRGTEFDLVIGETPVTRAMSAMAAAVPSPNAAPALSSVREPVSPPSAVKSGPAIVGHMIGG